MLQKVLNSPLAILCSVDSHLRFLKEGYYKRNTDEVLDYDTLFTFHMHRIEGLLDELEEVLEELNVS